MLCPRFFTRQGISKVEQENVYQKTLIISIRKRVLQKSQIKVSKSRHIWESSANRLWGTKIRFIPCKRRGKSSVTSHLLRFLFFALQMLTNVSTGHMIVTSMPTVTILWDPSHARANQHISETENTVQASVSFTPVIFAIMV